MVIFIPWDRIRKKSPKKQVQVCHLVLHHHSVSSITIDTKVIKPEEKKTVPGDPGTFPIRAVPGTKLPLPRRLTCHVKRDNPKRKFNLPTINFQGAR